MMSLLRKEACSGNIHDLSHIPTQHCLADCFSKACKGRQFDFTAVKTGEIAGTSWNTHGTQALSTWCGTFMHTSGEGYFIPECPENLSGTDASRRTMSCDVCVNSAYRGPRRN